MLTKEQIEAIEIGGRDDEWEMSGDLSMDDARELRRLALLGLERDERAERIGRAVLDSGFTVDDAEAVRTIYSWAGNGASRIVECMRAIAAAMEDSPATTTATYTDCPKCGRHDGGIMRELLRIDAPLGKCRDEACPYRADAMEEP